MKKYIPNFSDKRVSARIKLALEFINKTFQVTTAELYLSKSNLDKPEHLGHSGNKLSQYLRGMLLICTDPSYKFDSSSNKSKRYKMNITGARYLTEILQGTTRLSYSEYIDTNKNTNTQTHINVILLQHADEAFDKFKDEIDSGDFQMKQVGFREYHRLQTIPRNIRQAKFAKQGYVHDYDIETAAPSLLLQRARFAGLTKDTPVIDYFLENKTQIRNIIAQDCGIDYQQAKQVITAMFQGGMLSCYSHNRIYMHTLNYNTTAMRALQNHAVVQALKEEIKLVWQAISKTITRETYQTKSGVTKTRRLSGKQKTEIYLEVEASIMKEVKRYLKKDKLARFITEHDGWRCDRVIDVDDLRTYVRRRTGYMINIDYSKYDTADILDI